MSEQTTAQQYKEAFTAYLKADAEARAHNQQIVDAFIASIKPVMCRRVLLSTGVTLVTTAIDDHYYTVAEYGKLTRWQYRLAHVVGITEEYEVRPEDETEPFFPHYLNLGEYGVGQMVWLLAGTDVKALIQDFKDHMIRLPNAPDKGTLEWHETNQIEQSVRIELDPDYEGDEPF